MEDKVELEVRIDATLANTRFSVAQELDRLRLSDERWTVYREFVVLWPGNELEAEQTILFRDVRELLAAEEIAIRVGDPSQSSPPSTSPSPQMGTQEVSPWLSQT